MDRRTAYSQKVIKEALVELLSEKEIGKITVSEVAKKADVNRATFYRYYLDVYDLLDKIKKEFVDSLIEATKSDEKDTVSAFSKEILTVFLANKELVKVLFSSRNFTFFVNDVFELAYNKCHKKWGEDLKILDENDVEYATVFIFNGALGVVNYWINNDFDKSIDEIANCIESLSYYGIKKFIYKNKSIFSKN